MFSGGAGSCVGVRGLFEGAGAVSADAAFVVDMYCSCRCWCCV